MNVLTPKWLKRWSGLVFLFVVGLPHQSAFGHAYGPPHRHPPPMPYHDLRHQLHGYIAGQLVGTVVIKEVTDTTDYLGHGGGIGLFGGVRINPFFSVELNWVVSFHDERVNTRTGTVIILDNLYMNMFTGDVKVHIPTYGPVEPFFQAGVGYAFIGESNTDGIFASGPVFDAGGGIDIWLGPWFTLGGRVLYRGLVMGDADLPLANRSSNFISSISFDANVAFHF